MRFFDCCRQEGIPLGDRNLALGYDSTLPLRPGMGGSSASIIVALRALRRYFEFNIPLPIQAQLALEIGTWSPPLVERAFGLLGRVRID